MVPQKSTKDTWKQILPSSRWPRAGFLPPTRCRPPAPGLCSPCRQRRCLSNPERKKTTVLRASTNFVLFLCHFPHMIFISPRFSLRFLVPADSPSARRWWHAWPGPSSAPAVARTGQWRRQARSAELLRARPEETSDSAFSSHPAAVSSSWKF